MTRCRGGAALAAAVVVAGCAAGGPDAAGGDQVRVTGGIVAAAQDSTARVRVFKAIPFAAPPVGDLRWKAPQPPLPWQGVRARNDFPASCPMGNRPAGRPGAILYQPAPPQSEDCLYLNLWTSAPRGQDARLPVMVLLHGGGYQLGSGAQPNYDGAALAARGAVFVTMNYRLGPLGFMAHPGLTAESTDHASGNYAVMDAIAVLRWVRDNAAAFGGDPGNVTVVSESAGAGLASVLWASPPARGLFQRLVIESLAALPNGADTPTLAAAEKAGSDLAKAVGAPDLAALRRVGAEAIMAAPGPMPGPIVDGYVLPDQLDKLIARGAVADVPMLAGWNADEATPYPPFATTKAAYDTAVNARFGAMAERFRQVYPVRTDADAQAMAYAPMRDGFFAWEPWTLARAHAARGGQPTYVYYFERRPAYLPGQKFLELDPPARYGAHHTLEQVYFYDNLARSYPPRAFDDTDRRIARQASGYLLNFARTGNPNGSGLPAWPVLDLAQPRLLHLGEDTRPGPVPSQAALDFYDAFYAARLGRPMPVAGGSGNQR